MDKLAGYTLTSKVYTDESQTHYYDTIEEKFNATFQLGLVPANVLYDRIRKQVHRWHKSVLKQHKDRAWYIRVLPEITALDDGVTLGVYARYQFADTNIIHEVKPSE